jgi:hypothetical protein
MRVVQAQHKVSEDSTVKFRNVVLY